MTDHISIFRELSTSDLILIASIILFSWVLVRLNKSIFNLVSVRLSSTARYRVLVIQPIIRLIILFGSIIWIISLVILPTSENLFAILGATSIAIGFAFREYISSIIAGIVTLYENPYRTGDWIEFDGEYGEVISIGLRSVKIMRTDDTIIHIPQIKLWEHSIKNANSGSQNLMCVTKFYIGNDQDVNKARELLMQVAISCPYIQLDNTIALIVSDHPYHTQINLKAYPIEPRDQFKFMSDLIIRGKEVLQQNGIESPRLHLDE